MRLRGGAPARLFASVLLLLLAACAPQQARLSSASASAAWRADTSWAFENSDVPVDPGFRFGRLANGMRYVVRANHNPAGTAVVRMDVGAGSLDEGPAERGFAHYVEHMAFNGSAHVPEGEMVRLLEREGLAFGADTNASTGFEQTNYRLDLPTANPRLIDTALMLMRETASELTFSPEAVNRERGVVLSEMRDRNDWQYRSAVADAHFYHPQALYPERFPIGTAETIGGASAGALKAFWRREYVPAHVTLIVIGDFDAAAVEAAIRSRFESWVPAPAEPQPDAGPVLPQDRDRVATYIDPALSERVVAARHGPWQGERDTVAQRRENLLRQIGYGIVNRRLLRIARQAEPPFRGAGFGTGPDFKSGRTTRLIVDTVDGKWQPGLEAAVREYRRAMKSGFTASEIAEQVAGIRVQAEVAARGAETRTSAALADAALGLVRDRMVPSDPRTALDRLNAFIPEITPERVLAALKRDAVAIKAPLIRFQGKHEPAGGERAIRTAWRAAMAAKLPAEAQSAAGTFAYAEFGTPGTIASDTAGPLGIRQIRFANGVMLNLRRTQIERDAVLVKLSIDGGNRLRTKTEPLATEMFASLPEGGLGKHSEDELQSLLAGHAVSDDLGTAEDSFVGQARTNPGDLGLQLRLYAAFVTDPGYRPEGQTQYRLQINNFFARKDATPASALQTSIGGILSDGDPRFTLQSAEAYRQLTYAGLKKAVSDRLARGAIEIGLVGDVDEAEAIALVAGTFGALPPREPAFHAFSGEPSRPFTADRKARVIRHTGAADQALLRLTFPTRDDTDPVETLKLELLEKVVRIELTDSLREKLGKTYSPGAGSSPSHYWPGYGTFAIGASIDVREVAAARAAMLETLRGLRSAPIDADLLQRARQPMIEAFDNGLKSNAGWLSLVDRAQSEPATIDRYRNGRAWLEAMTAAEMLAMAQKYLDPAAAVEVLVLPKDAAPPG